MSWLKQHWGVYVILLVIVVELLWVSYNYLNFLEKQAWLECIKENDQVSAQNLVCRSLYPKPYKIFYKEYNQ